MGSWGVSQSFPLALSPSTGPRVRTRSLRSLFTAPCAADSERLGSSLPSMFLHHTGPRVRKHSLRSIFAAPAAGPRGITRSASEPVEGAWEDAAQRPHIEGPAG